MRHSSVDELVILASIPFAEIEVNAELLEARVIVLRSLRGSCVAIRKMFLKVTYPFSILRRCKFPSHPLDELH